MDAQENCGQQPGDWITLASKDDNGKTILAIGHRRGAGVHIFLSTHGKTLAGKPQAHKEELDEATGTAIPRKCPMVLNVYSSVQPWIDMNNRCRQDLLAIEEAHRTNIFPMRYMTTLLGGMIPTDCYRASVYFHGEEREFLHYCRELVYEGLTNTLDPGPPERGPSPSPSTSSSGSTCEEHKVGTLKMVGWTGSSQLTCAICGEKVTTCCIECSNSTSVVALCKSEHWYKGELIKSRCIEVHRRYPLNSRRSVPRPQNKKQNKKRPRDSQTSE